ncbi:polyamine ABC transporter substrate-binding protein [Vibrio sp. TRT 21S02]|uniref:polyamine ABC transporter substrate-binding protein n=1 Tax=unclassified Vibrio TaxID=2614977 RepID=UPI00349F65E9
MKWIFTLLGGMKKTLFIALIWLITFSSRAHDSGLSIYLWEDTLSQDLMTEWENQNNSTLTQSHFDNDDQRSQLMLNSTELPFDIVVLDNISAQIYGKLGQFEDLSDLKNRSHNGSKWLKACGKYAVPYFWGTVGLVYRKDNVTTPPKTWSDFVNPPAELRGHIGMLNDSVDSFLPFFYSMGTSPLTDKTSEIEAVYPIFAQFSQHVLSYEYVLSYIRSHTNANKMKMALAYSGDQYSMNRFLEEDLWQFVTPEGEIYLWVDCLAVNSASSHKKQAKAFIEFMMDPANAAKNAIDVKAATPNSSALKLLPEWYLNDASLFPNRERVEQGQIDSPLSAENISLRAKIINTILKRHEAQH